MGLEIPLTTSRLPPLGTPVLVWPLGTPFPTHTCCPWYLCHGLPQHHSHRLVPLVGGISVTLLTPSCKEAGQTSTLRPRQRQAGEAGRLCLQLRQKVQFWVQGTTINNTAKGRRGGKQGDSVCFSAGVRQENLGPFEGEEEGVSQDREADGGEEPRTEVPDEAELKPGKTGPSLAVHAVGVQQIYGADAEPSEKGTCH